MKKLVSGAAIVVALAVGSPVHAADMARPVYKAAPMVVPVYNWSGFYIGGHGGYGWGKTRDTNNPAAVGKDLSGGLGGVQVGYNWQLSNNVVFGLEGDVSFGSVKEKWIDDNPFSGYWTEDKVDVSGTVRARLGYAFDRFLPYVTGGLAIVNTKHELGCSAAFAVAPGSCNGGPRQQFTVSKSDTSTGYVIGAGMEFAVTNNWTVRAEYLYTDIGTNDVTLLDPNWPGAISQRKFDTNFSTVRFGVNYKF